MKPLSKDAWDSRKPPHPVLLMQAIQDDVPRPEPRVRVAKAIRVPREK